MQHNEFYHVMNSFFDGKHTESQLKQLELRQRRLQERRALEASLSSYTSPLTKFQTISLHFDLPLNEAAEKFGIRATAFKKRCRSIGIRHWPYRKVRSLKRTIFELSSYKERGTITEKQRFTLLSYKRQLDEVMSPHTYGIKNTTINTTTTTNSNSISTAQYDGASSDSDDNEQQQQHNHFAPNNAAESSATTTSSSQSLPATGFLRLEHPLEEASSSSSSHASQFLLSPSAPKTTEEEPIAVSLQSPSPFKSFGNFNFRRPSLLEFAEVLDAAESRSSSNSNNSSTTTEEPLYSVVALSPPPPLRKQQIHHADASEQQHHYDRQFLDDLFVDESHVNNVIA